MADGRDAADREAGELRASFAFARRTSGSPVTAARRARSTRLGPDTRHRIGLERAVGGRRDEHERLHDLPELGVDGRRGLLRRVRRLGEHVDVERHALAGGGVDDALDRGGVRGSRARRRVYTDGGGRSAACRRVRSRAVHAPTGPPRRSSWRTGDVPARAALDAAWPGWDAGVDAVIAADGGLRACRRRSGSTPTSSSGDLDSLDPTRVERRRRAGVADPAVARRQGRVRHGARAARGGPPRRDPDHGPRRVRRSAPRPRARQPVAARPPGAGRRRRWCCSTRRPASSLLGAPGPDGGAVERALPGPIGGTVTLLPFAGDVDGVTTRGLRYPLRDEPLAPARPGACPTSATGAGRGGHASGAGRLLVVETASSTAQGYPRRMSMPQAGDLAPEVALPDEHRHDPPPLRPARLLDRRLLLPRGRHARVHDRGLPVPRPARGHHGPGRRDLGHQPGRLRQPRRLPREVRAAVHAPLGRGPRGRRGVRRLAARRPTTAGRTWGSSARASSSTPTGGSRRPGRR